MNSKASQDASRRSRKTLLIVGMFALILPRIGQAAAVPPLTPAAVIAHGEERFRKLTDYECMVDIEARQGKKVEIGEGQFWFKQPRLLRLHVIRGSGKGSDVVVDTSGQIRGRKKGLLSFIVTRLKAGDRRIHNIRGTSMLELDWGSFFLRYHASTLRPDATVSMAARTDERAPYQVVITYPDLGKAVREVYSLDSQRWVILEGELYEDNVRMEHVVFREIKLDTGVDEKWFKL